MNPRYGMVRHGAINAPEAKRPSNATTATTSSSSLSSELMKCVVRGWVRPSKSSVASTLRHAADGVSQRIAEGCDEATCTQEHTKRITNTTVRMGLSGDIEMATKQSTRKRDQIRYK